MTLGPEIMMSVLRSVVLYVIAGLCEIGGGWLIWKWLREDRPGWWGLAGGLVLMIYGVIPTLQSAHFGRVYAAYGGVLHRAVIAVGLAPRRHSSGPGRRARREHRPGRGVHHDVLAATVTGEV